jgi:nucleoside-diphosphate-sugar epimerase
LKSDASFKTALILGAGGFIGSHLVRRLKSEGFWVRGVDQKYPLYSESLADDFIIGDLRDPYVSREAFDKQFDEVYQFAADMGGAGYIFSGENDADIMRNSTIINLNILDSCRRSQSQRIFYSSSACIYPKFNQLDTENPNLTENSAYPAQPDSDYGWERLYGERLYLAFHRNYNLKVRIARFHNIFGPEGTWQGGKEKVPAAICRKVSEASDGGSIDMWGDGEQTRTFLYIDECIEGSIRLMRSDWTGPVNIGSEEIVSINQLAKMVMKIAGKKLTINHTEGPQGVRGRKSDNLLISQKLNWKPTQSLAEGLKLTYSWIDKQIKQKKSDRPPVSSRIDSV